jgi:hypothetical protein
MPLIGSHKRAITEPPEPIALEQWKAKVGEALLLKSERKPSPEIIKDAVDEILKEKVGYAFQIAWVAAHSSPSVRKKELKGRITALKKASKTVREELVSELDAGILSPLRLDSSPTSLSIPADIAWHDYQESRDPKTRAAFELKLIYTAGGYRSYNYMVQHVDQTLRLLDALTEHFQYINSMKDSDRPDVTTSASKLKFPYILGLMKIFCDLREEPIGSVEIGSAESMVKSDDGSYPNPLLNFLTTAVAPIAEPKFENPDWIPPGTLRGIAEDVRRYFRSC